MDIYTQLVWLFVLAIPVACISWTVTQEDVFLEFRNYCKRCKTDSKSLVIRKFFYLFTCEYCFSHYITILMLFITGYQLLFQDWRGYFIAGFSLVWIANIYMSLFYYIYIRTKVERTDAHLKEKKLKDETGKKIESS